MNKWERCKRLNGFGVPIVANKPDGVRQKVMLWWTGIVKCAGRRLILRSRRAPTSTADCANGAKKLRRRGRYERSMVSSKHEAIQVLWLR